MIIGMMAGGLVVVLCLCAGVMGAVLLFTAGNAQNPTTASATPPSSSGTGQPHVVTYSASSPGSSIGEIGFYDSTGLDQNIYDVTSPWTDTETIDSGVVDYITLNVNQMGGDSPVTCSITVDGRQVDSKAVTSGPYQDVICSADLS
ncbi:MmpS family transport accessory protein [Fodinicola feengrottensis]|uniref:MmpS family transport accessory protein n=1 Tax=Fodinicola feengrottensis TaxID=435914 RepID=UPI0031DC14FB